MSKSLERRPAELALARSPAARQRYEDALAAFLAGLESEASRRAYQYDWQLYVKWLGEARGKPPAEARTGDVQAYLEALRNGDYRSLATSQPGSPLGKSTRQRALSVLRSVYGVFVRAELLEVNPAREARNVRGDPALRTPWLTEEEIRRVSQALAKRQMGFRARRDRVIFDTLFLAALRRQELARLDWAQVRLDDPPRLREIRVKGGKLRTYPIPGALAATLGAWRRYLGDPRSGPVFPVRPGSERPISPETVYAALKRIGAEAGIPADKATPHALRRSFNTIARRRGISLKARQGAMGHAKSSTTERYDMEEAVFEEVPGEALGDLVSQPDKGPDQ